MQITCVVGYLRQSICLFRSRLNLNRKPHNTGRNKRLYTTVMDTAVHSESAPKTLQEWRSQKHLPAVEGYSPRPRNVWIPLEPFFLSHGYTLWGPRYSMYPTPPNDEPRTPDGFAYRTVYCEIKPNVPHFDMIVSQTLIFTSQVWHVPSQEIYSLPSAHD